MVIKNYTLELKGYEESKIIILIYTYNKGKRSYTILNSIINFLITLKPSFLKNVIKVWFLNIFSLKNLIQ